MIFCDQQGSSVPQCLWRLASALPYAQQEKLKSALILFLVKDFHVSLSGREEDWLGSEATTPEEQKELEALEVHGEQVARGGVFGGEGGREAASWKWKINTKY